MTLTQQTESGGLASLVALYFSFLVELMFDGASVWDEPLGDLDLREGNYLVYATVKNEKLRITLCRRFPSSDDPAVCVGMLEEALSEEPPAGGTRGTGGTNVAN